MKILITGSEGFLGKNLKAYLTQFEDVEVFAFDLSDTLDELEGILPSIDFIFHLAGVNRPENNEEYYSGNSDLTQSIVDILVDLNLTIPILFSSSVQAEYDNDYGKSKLFAEETLREYCKKSGTDIYIYRLPNLFGKWSRPNYNSVIATWCYNMARDIPLRVDNPKTEIEFAYIDDVVRAFSDHLFNTKINNTAFYSVNPTHIKNLAEIKELLELFRASRDTLVLPPVEDGFERALYATYLSYLPEDKFAYPVVKHEDERGFFSEVFKTDKNGQVSMSVTKPGIERGHHYHHTKNEKFLVAFGEALVRFRHIYSKDVIEYKVDGNKPQLVDIPPGYTHSIKNIGDSDMVLFIWANEVFVKDKPDTIFLKV